MLSVYRGLGKMESFSYRCSLRKVKPLARRRARRVLRQRFEQELQPEKPTACRETLLFVDYHARKSRRYSWPLTLEGMLNALRNIDWYDMELWTACGDDSEETYRAVEHDLEAHMRAYGRNASIDVLGAL